MALKLYVPTATVTQIVDVTTKTVTGTIARTGFAATDVALNRVILNSGGSLYTISPNADTATLLTASVNTSNPVTVNPVNSHIYQWNSRVITVKDSAGATVTTITVPSPNTIYSLDCTPDGSRLFVSFRGAVSGGGRYANVYRVSDYALLGAPLANGATVALSPIYWLADALADPSTGNSSGMESISLNESNGTTTFHWQPVALNDCFPQCCFGRINNCDTSANFLALCYPSTGLTDYVIRKIRWTDGVILTTVHFTPVPGAITTLADQSQLFFTTGNQKLNFGNPSGLTSTQITLPDSVTNGNYSIAYASGTVPPPAPTGFIPFGTSTNNNGAGCYNLLQWTTAASTTWNLQRATDLAFTQNVVTLATGLTGTTYGDPMTTANDGVSYYYRLIAVVSGVQSNPSAVVSIVASCPACACVGFAADASVCTDFQPTGC